MNVYVMVDIEGISGIYAREQVLPSEPKFAEGRRFMTEDINACIKGLKEAGVDKIYVRDCHAFGNTVIWEGISEDADYIINGICGEERFVGVEDCDAVILLGYHAMAGTKGGILEHTFNSRCVQNAWMNGEKVGEIAIDAGILGDLGKPVIMVSGDDKTCAEAKAVLPNVVTAEVKKGLSPFGGMLMPCDKAHKLITEKAKEAVLKFKDMKPYIVSKPVEIKFEVTERTVLPRMVAHEGLCHIDGRTVKVTADTVEQALMRAMVF